MAICKWCPKDMEDDSVISCDRNTHVDFAGFREVPSIPHRMHAKRCHDCNVKPGGLHHPGCDMEQCPRCRGQLISCGCLDGDG